MKWEGRLAAGVTNARMLYSGREGDGEASGGAATGEESGGWSRQGEGDAETRRHGDQHARILAADQR